MFLIHRKCSLCQKSPKNNARKGVLEKSLPKTTRERVFWEKVSQKQRAKGGFGKKSPRNNARKGVLEKSLPETTRERVFWEKVSQKQRAKGCFGKKYPKNNARKGVLEKSLPKTTRERVFWKKVSKNNARKGSPFLKPCRMCAGGILLCFAPFFCLLALPIGK